MKRKPTLNLATGSGFCCAIFPDNLNLYKTSSPNSLKKFPSETLVVQLHSLVTGQNQSPSIGAFTQSPVSPCISGTMQQAWENLKQETCGVIIIERGVRRLNL